MAFYGYCRVSTDEQAGEDKTSLSSQEARIALCAASNGWPVDQVFIDDGVSGSIPLRDRPEGSKLAGLLQRGDRIAAAKLDRMFRSASDALSVTEAWAKRDVSLFLLDIGMDPVTTSITGRLFFSIVAAFAEFERGRIRERLMDSIAARRKAGRLISGKPPFGYMSIAGALQPEPAQQAAIATMLEMHSASKSLRAIKKEIDVRHCLKVSHVAINSVIKRHALAVDEATLSAQ